jgi:hypothetical protein
VKCCTFCHSWNLTTSQVCITSKAITFCDRKFFERHVLSIWLSWRVTLQNNIYTPSFISSRFPLCLQRVMELWCGICFGLFLLTIVVQYSPSEVRWMQHVFVSRMYVQIVQYILFSCRLIFMLNYLWLHTEFAFCLIPWLKWIPLFSRQRTWGNDQFCSISTNSLNYFNVKMKRVC